MDDRMGFTIVQTSVEHNLSTQASIKARDLIAKNKRLAAKRERTHALALTDEYY